MEISSIFRLMKPSEYKKLMEKDQRLLVIYNKTGRILGYIFFSICNEYFPFAAKKTWDYMPHNQDGRICFVEKAVSAEFNRQVLREIEILITSVYPKVEEAIWFRPGKDKEKKVVYKRRHYEASLRN